MRRACRPSRGLLLEAPADGPQPFEPPGGDVEDEADRADEEHPRHDEIVALARISRVDDEIAQARVDRDHLGGHDDEPRDSESDAQAHADLRQRRWEDDAGEEAGRGQAEIAAGLEVHRGDAPYS